MKRDFWPSLARLAPLALALALLGAGAGSRAAMADVKKPIVVELFTSQGCANCPKANAFLGKLSKEPDVIALTYAVGYWDYLGWRDTFAKPEFAARQKSYAAKLRQGGVYTPEMVVNGAAHASGSKADNVRALMARKPNVRPAQIAIESESQIIVSGDRPAQPADVWLVEYAPGPMFVQVTKGENAGVNMPHFNLVTKLERLGIWRGGPQRFDAVCATACVVIVQSARGGPVLAAAKTS